MAFPTRKPNEKRKLREVNNPHVLESPGSHNSPLTDMPDERTAIFRHCVASSDTTESTVCDCKLIGIWRQESFQGRFTA
jgi:hypothetical protein